MDDNKLKHLIHSQRPQPGQGFDERVSRQALTLITEEEPMKKKVSVLAICVAAIVSIALFGATAELLGLNLFELFGKEEPGIAQLAPQAVLQEVSPITVTSPELGSSTASINSAYYDGRSLIVAFAIQGGRQLVPFTPTAKQLAQMEKSDNPPIMAIRNPDRDGLIKDWNTAVQAGKPFGFAEYTISPSDHTRTAEGMDLPPNTEGQLPGEDGHIYYIRRYDSPLPDGAQNQEKLAIEISLSKLIQYWYFDGQQAYTSQEREQLEAMKATVWRADARIKRFEGSCSFAGHSVEASVIASAASAQVTVRMTGGLFPTLPEDAWYAVYLRDQNQLALRPHGGGMGGVASMLIDFDGTGQLPEKLALQLRVDAEDGVQLDDALKQSVFMKLTELPQ